MRIAEENLNLGFVFTDCLSKRVYINSTLRPVCTLDRLLLLKCTFHVFAMTAGRWNKIKFTKCDKKIST